MVYACLYNCGVCTFTCFANSINTFFVLDVTFIKILFTGNVYWSFLVFCVLLFPFNCFLFFFLRIYHTYNLSLCLFLFLIIFLTFIVSKNMQNAHCMRVFYRPLLDYFFQLPLYLRNVSECCLFPIFYFLKKNSLKLVFTGN